MHLFRMGPDAGPHRVGVNRDAASLFERQRSHLPPGSHFSVVDVDAGVASVALAQLRRRKAMRGDWLFVKSVDADILINEAARLVVQALNRVDDKGALDTALFGRAMHYIRTEIFGTTQEMIGQIAGRSESLVSRWESGDVVPGFDEIMRLRSVAVDLDLGWDDRLLLEPGTYLQPTNELETNDGK